MIIYISFLIDISILSNRLEDEEHVELQNQINEIKTSDPKSKIELFFKEGFSSTVEAILKIRDQSKDHYIVMNDDLSIKASSIYSMMDRHRLEDSSLSVVLRKVIVNSDQNKKKGGQQKKQEDFDIACLAENDSILAYITSSRSDIKVPTSLFRKFEDVSFRNVKDLCFYMFSKQAMNLFEKRIEYLMQENGGGLSNYSNITLKNDVIPYLLKRQYSENKKANESQIEFQFKCLVSMFWKKKE